MTDCVRKCVSQLQFFEENPKGMKTFVGCALRTGTAHPSNFLWIPIGNEDVEFPRFLSMAR